MKPRILVKTMDLNRCVDGIDFVEMPKLPYNFERLRSIIIKNIEEFTDLVDNFERSGWFDLDQINDFRLIIEAVKEMNADYLKVREYESNN